INESFWDEAAGSYCDFYGSQADAIMAAEGAMTQVQRMRERGQIQADDKLIAYYEHLREKFSGMPEGYRGWITNKNWVITTPMETGIAPRQRAIPLLEKIRKEHVGEYGPYLAAAEKLAMMT